MPSMPGLVTQTPTFRFMNTEWSKSPDGFMNDYEKKSFEVLLDEADLTDTIKQHVTQHWLDEYWPTADAKEVLQRGLYWAMRVAVFEEGSLDRRRRDKAGNPSPLPICCAWVCSDSKPKKLLRILKTKARFEVVTIASEKQVTLLFITPEPKGIHLPKPNGYLQLVWSTRRSEFAALGEEQIDAWNSTITVRPWDSEDYPKA